MWPLTKLPFLNRWVQTSKEKDYGSIGLTTDFSQAHGGIIAVLQTLRSGRIPVHLNWYNEFLRSRLQIISPAIIAVINPSVNGLSSDGRFHRVVEIAERIAAVISLQKHVTVQQITEQLCQGGSLVVTAQTQTSAWQLVFALVGLITFLYSPHMKPPLGVFKIEINDTRWPTRSHFKRLTWKISEVRVEEASGYSLDNMLRRFSGKGPIPLGMNFPQLAELDVLRSCNLGYYVLSEIAKIKIEWVDSICEHLEFDSTRSLLKLFRFPSFCGMMCLSDLDDRTTHLCRLFNDYYADDLATKDHSLNIKSVEFFSEMLLSYRLIFGQDKKSYKTFRSQYKKSDAGKRSDIDPQLIRLCGYNWRKQSIYLEIDAPGAKTVYSAKADFPFFSERLIALQEYVLTQSPNDWKTLWRDRRDLNRFWTLWAVLIFGIITIFFNFVQIGLGIAQVVVTISG